MKTNTIINRYIFKEMIPTFLLSMTFMTFVFLLSQILKIMNMLVNYHAGVTAFLLLILYSLPAVCKFTIPMSIMIAILMTFLRMAVDNEIIAIKVGGGSIYQLMPPVLLFCLIGWFVTLIMSLFGVAWGNTSYKGLALDIAGSFTEAAIKEQVFNDSLDGVMIYVNQIDPQDRTLHDIFIEDQRDPKSQSTVIAPFGKKLISPDKTAFTLRLHNGIINRVDMAGDAVHTISFDTYDIHINLKKTVSRAADAAEKDPDEMNLRELQAFIHNRNAPPAKKREALMELHEKISIPFACFTLGLLGIPLGLKSAFMRQSSGLGLGVSCFLLFYLLLGIGWSAVKAGYISALLGMWLPNLIMGALGVYFLIRVANERSIGIDYFIELFYRIKNRLSQKTA